MSWTFNGIAFAWLQPMENGLYVAPAWKRQPRLVVRPLLDSGDADVSRIGYEPWRMSGLIAVEDPNVSALEALNGELALLSNGAASWSAILAIELSQLRYATIAGATGSAVFTRPRA